MQRLRGGDRDFLEILCNHSHRFLSVSGCAIKDSYSLALSEDAPVDPLHILCMSQFIFSETHEMRRMLHMTAQIILTKEMTLKRKF